MYEVLISHLRECAKLDPNENTFNEAADAIEELSYKYEKALSDLVKESNSKRQCPVCGRENCFKCAYCGADIRGE